MLIPVVKVLCYKSKGRWFDPNWCHRYFSLTYNPSDRTMAMGSNQPLTEISTRSISPWGKSGRCVRPTTLSLSSTVVMKSGNLNFLEPSAPLQTGNGIAFPLSVLIKRFNIKKFWGNFPECVYIVVICYTVNRSVYVQKMQCSV